MAKDLDLATLWVTKRMLKIILLIFSCQGREIYHDHEGGLHSVRLLHCTHHGCTGPCDFPKGGKLIVEDCILTLPLKKILKITELIYLLAPKCDCKIQQGICANPRDRQAASSFGPVSASAVNQAAVICTVATQILFA